LNTEKHLILINDEDKTDPINYCEYTNGKYKVSYNSATANVFEKLKKYDVDFSTT
jgi:hypothetical protein